MIRNINCTPELFIEVYDEKYGLFGYLAIDTTVGGRCWGGVRIMPELSAEEMRLLARTMTLKYGFLGFRLGGAKAGVIVNKKATREEKDEILFKFGQKIGVFIRSGIFIPGTDMNCTVEDMRALYQGAQMNARFSKFKDISYVYTSWTVVEAIKASIAKLGLHAGELTAAIQGFGKVGSESAKLLSKMGVKIVAVSTVKGAIYNEKGLDIAMLIDIREKHGDDCVHRTKETMLPREEVLFLDTDILVPASTSLCINAENYQKIKAKIISCAANAPMSDDIYEKLHDKGIVVIPDAVANCGGVFGSYLERSCRYDDIYRIVNEKYSRTIDQLIEKSFTTNVSLRRLSIEIITKRFLENKRMSESSARSRFVRWVGTNMTRIFHKVCKQKYDEDVFVELT